MDTSSTLWSWIVDSRCYSILQNAEKFFKKDAERVATDFMEAANGLCYDKATLQNATRHLDDKDTDDMNNRILLSCLAIHIYLGKEPYNFFYDDGMEGQTSLKSVLNFIHKLKYCFDDKSHAVFYKMWLATFNQVLICSGSRMDMQSNYDNIVARYKNDLPESVLKLCSVPTELPNVDVLYSEYISHMLGCIKKLNSTLTKPFLLKVEAKVENVLESNDKQVPLSIARHVCQLLNSQLLNLNMRKDAKEFANRIKNPDSTNLDFSSDSEFTSDVDKPCNSCEKIFVLSAEDGDEYYSASSSMHDSTEKECFQENNDISENESSIITNVSNKESIPNSENSITDYTRGRVWSLELDSYIILGVAMFGIGSWQKIKRYFPFPSLNTGTHIKDRWRTMIRKQLVEIDEEKNLKYIDPCYENCLQSVEQRFQKKNEVGQCNGKSQKAQEMFSSNSRNFDEVGQASLISETSKIRCDGITTTPMLQQHSATSRAWTRKLDGYIIFGVVTFGVGSWAMIKKSFPFPHKKHGGHIKDRWRTLIKKKLVEFQPGKVKYSSIFKKYVSEARQHLKILSPQLSCCLSAGLLKGGVDTCSSDTVTPRTTRSKTKKLLET